MKKMIALLAIAVMGIAMTGCKNCNQVPQEEVKAPLRISVIGDSYSAFAGWIPEGNTPYYSETIKGNDVNKAEYCWWYLVAQDIQGELDKIEAWSGSTIGSWGYRNEDFSWFSFITRANRLGNPDIILICGGTNDSWSGAPEGEAKWSDWTKEDLFTFRPAVAKLLHDLQEYYPNARIIFVLNNNLRAEIINGVHDACQHYGVECVDLHDIDKQLGHPSIAGMRAIADQVVAQINQQP